MDSGSPLADYDRILGGKFASPEPNEEEEEEIELDGDAKPIYKPELRKVVQLTDEDGKHHILGFENYKPARGRAQKRAAEEAAPKKEPFRDSAMLLKAVVSQRGFWGAGIDLKLEIQSEALRKLFQEHAKRYRELNLDAEPIVVDYPFKCLFFLRPKLKEIHEDPKTPSNIKKQLFPLLSFIEEPLGVQKHIEVYDDLVLKQHHITFSMLWSIFPPYTPVIVEDKEETDGTGAGHLVEHVNLKFENHMPQWELSLLHGHHNGTCFSVRQTTKVIRFFSGKKEINLRHLGILPLHLVEEKQRTKMWDTMVERGKKYVNYCTEETTFLHYKGQVNLQHSENKARLGAWGSAGVLEIDERMVLDRTAQHRVDGYSDEFGSNMATCLEEYFSTAVGGEKPTATVSPKVFHFVTLADVAMLGKGKEAAEEQLAKGKETTLLDGPAVDAEPKQYYYTDEDYFICQPNTVGFALDQKAWVYNVRVSLLKEIEWQGDPFSSLQFTDGAKKLVGRLVKGFNNRKEDLYDDIIKGKGKGLIFLLHGPPGLGKTLTAESVAESAQRPLYRVTTGELSTDVKQLEKQLSDIFRLGARWRAVVLLDEADVLMSKRTVQDLQRNAIVAVFLRLLEYYRGMLFLTTNRIEDFDEAFHSRIHVTLEYSALTPEWRTNIWRQHVTKASGNNKMERLWNDEMFTALGEIDTNGRDIKNFARTAYAFAQAEEEDLTLQHMLIVLVNNLTEQRRKRHAGTFRKLEALEKKMLAEMEAAKEAARAAEGVKALEEKENAHEAGKEGTEEAEKEEESKGRESANNVSQ